MIIGMSRAANGMTPGLKNFKFFSTKIWRVTVKAVRNDDDFGAG
jgi:hypothetical protein